MIKDFESIKEEVHEKLLNILKLHFKEKKPFKPAVKRENNRMGGCGGLKPRLRHFSAHEKGTLKGCRESQNKRMNQNKTKSFELLIFTDL